MYRGRGYPGRPDIGGVDGETEDFAVGRGIAFGGGYYPLCLVCLVVFGLTGGLVNGADGRGGTGCGGGGEGCGEGGAVFEGGGCYVLDWMGFRDLCGYRSFLMKCRECLFELCEIIYE